MIRCHCEEAHGADEAISHAEVASPAGGRIATTSIAVAAILLVAAASQAAESKPAISVLYFDNNTGRADYDLLRKGLTDMMVTDLVAWDGVTVVERQKLEAVLHELKLQQSKDFDAGTRQKIGKLLNAQYLLTGMVNLAGQTLAIDAQLVEVQTGAVRVTARASGAPDRVFDLEQELINKIAGGIDARLRDAGQRRKVKAPNLDALLAYSQAIDLSDQGKLEEAQKAMQQLVSKSPTFLMARERKEAILQQLLEVEKRRKDIVSGSALEVGRIAQAELGAEAKFDTLDEAAQRRFLAMRVVEGRFLARLLKQQLSFRDEHFRVVRKGHEAEALKGMRAWAENQRRGIDEYERFARQRTTFVAGRAVRPSTHVTLDDATANLIRDANFGEVRIEIDVDDLARFVLEGRLSDGGDAFTVAPALGDLDASEQKAVFDLLDKRVAAALSGDYQKPGRDDFDAWRGTEIKAAALERLDRDDDAVAAYQKFLDASPAAAESKRAEQRIREIIGVEHDHSRYERERWAKALQGCEDMDIRVGMGTLRRHMARMGLSGIAAQASELEKACPLTPKLRSAFAYMYKDLALASATHEDCDGFQSWFRKYVQADGSVADMLGYQKNYAPWCELGDVTKSVVWMNSNLDKNWTLEFNQNLTSVRSSDGKELSLTGSKQMMANGRDSLSFFLDATGPDTFSCRSARWHRFDEKTPLEGGCDVRITKLARERGDFDEGTYSATFETIEPTGWRRKIELSDGSFRLRRQ
jgi:TolB-like protein